MIQGSFFYFFQGGDSKHPFGSRPQPKKHSVDQQIGTAIATSLSLDNVNVKAEKLNKFANGQRGPDPRRHVKTDVAICTSIGFICAHAMVHLYAPPSTRQCCLLFGALIDDATSNMNPQRFHDGFLPQSMLHLMAPITYEIAVKRKSNTFLIKTYEGISINNSFRPNFTPPLLPQTP